MPQPPRRSIREHRDLDVYQMAFAAAMDIFALSKAFPAEGRYALTDQSRRAPRAVCANIAEAWRRRSYEKAFILGLNNAEAEAAETQTWLEFARACNYLPVTEAQRMTKTYDHIIGKLVTIRNHPAPWLLKNPAP